MQFAKGTIKERYVIHYLACELLSRLCNGRLSAKEQFNFLKLLTFATLPKIKHVVLGMVMRSMDLLIVLKLDSTNTTLSRFGNDFQ